MTADTLEGKVLADRYLVGGRIDDQGHCLVYTATHVVTKGRVILRILGPETAATVDGLERFRASTEVVALLRHPGIVRVLDAGETREGLHYVALETLVGRSLRLEMDRGRITPARALGLVEHAAWPLHEAHLHGVVHRDVKPENIFLCPASGYGDFVRLLFTTASKWGGASVKTQQGLYFGTPAYVSPEQVRGDTPSPSADIYSLGVVLYEMLAGKVPFEGELPTQVVIKHLSEPPPPLVGVAENVARLVMRLLAKDAAERPSSCEDLARECAALQKTIPDRDEPEADDLLVPESTMISEPPTPPGDAAAVRARIIAALGRAAAREVVEGLRIVVSRSTAQRTICVTIGAGGEVERSELPAGAPAGATAPEVHPLGRVSRERIAALANLMISKGFPSAPAGSPPPGGTIPPIILEVDAAGDHLTLDLRSCYVDEAPAFIAIVRAVDALALEARP